MTDREKSLDDALCEIVNQVKMDVVDLRSERTKRDRPSAEFVKKDDFGRELFCFALSYDLDGDAYCTQVWAYDIDDAKKKVAAQRESLRLDGQLMSSIPG